MARRAHRLPGSGAALLLGAWLFSACGGTDNGRPQATPAPDLDAGVSDPCRAPDGLQLQTITTFDPPLGATRTRSAVLCDPGVNTRGIACSTYYNFDTAHSPRTCGGPLTSSPVTCRLPTLDPLPDAICMETTIDSAGPAKVTPIPGGRCGVSTDAFHLAGRNIATCFDPIAQKQGWGSSFQLTLGSDTMNSGDSAAPFDASAWDGISLWVRRGSEGVHSALLISVADRSSAWDRSRPISDTNCNGADPLPGQGPLPDATKCDAFGAGVLLTTDWRFVKLPFAKLRQKGFGLPSPLGHLDTKGIHGIKFELTAGNWDVWIDDLAFYREPQ